MAQADDQKCVIGVMLAFVSFLVYSEVAPYKHPLNNGIVKVAQCVILLTYGSAAAIETGVSSWPHGRRPNHRKIAKFNIAEIRMLRARARHAAA